MGSSDFDAHTFAQYGSFAIGVKAHCPLKQKPPTVETACFETSAEGNHCQGKLAKKCRTLEMTFSRPGNKTTVDSHQS
jgi:hypothetical protein